MTMPACGHVMCSECIKKIDERCPFCRRSSEGSFRIYNDAEDELAAGLSSLSLDIQVLVKPMRGNMYCLTVKITDSVASLKAKIRFFTILRHSFN